MPTMMIINKSLNIEGLYILSTVEGKLNSEKFDNLVESYQELSNHWTIDSPGWR